MTYPDGAVATTSYSQGWLAGASWTQNSVTTLLVSAVSYSGASGAFGAITSAQVGQNAGAALYHATAQLDTDGRPSTTTLSRVSDGATLYSEQLTYDPVGNVSAVSTTLPQGTDNQAFCYDEQNRLVWAGTTSGNPCNNPATVGSFGGASYTQSFGYDPLNRLTSGPLGSYTYGDSAHLHAATSVSSGSSQYTASYDAAGDMTCRAPSSATTCAGGSPTGQQLTWDAEGRLAAWQNTPTSPTLSASYLYDGEGNRVVQQVTDSTTGMTTTTSYIGSLETVTTNGTTTTTTDYAAAGNVLATSVSGTLSYLATNYEGSVVEALDGSGVVGVTASQLYAPYGGVRYASGALPTDYGYTRQRADASTGLDYYGARYYDPLLGQFTSADTLLAGGTEGLNRYAYVGGNPTSATDPSGHVISDGPQIENGGRVESSRSDSTGEGGGGGSLPPINLWPLIKAIGAWVGAVGTDISEAVAVPTALAPGFTWSPTGNDELTRALHQAGPASLDDMPYWNQVGANRYQASHPAPTTPTDTPTPPEPQTQPGGGGAGAPPGGGQPPVAGPVHPEDDNGCGCGRPINSRGDPYPSVIDPRTGQEMPFPEGVLQRLADGEKPVEWNNMTRGAYIKEWLDRGYPEPEGGWKPYDIHHILPRDFGGTNDFWNLVPVLRTIHNGPASEGVSAWWQAYCPD